MSTVNKVKLRIAGWFSLNSRKYYKLKGFSQNTGFSFSTQEKFKKGFFFLKLKEFTLRLIKEICCSWSEEPANYSLAWKFLKTGLLLSGFTCTSGPTNSRGHSKGSRPHQKSKWNWLLIQAMAESQIRRLKNLVKIENSPERRALKNLLLLLVIIYSNCYNLLFC